MTTPEPGGTPGTPVTLLDEAWVRLWDDLRHHATGLPSGRIIIAAHRPAIEAEAARSERERLARAVDDVPARHCIPCGEGPGHDSGIDRAAVLALLRDPS